MVVTVVHGEGREQEARAWASLATREGVTVLTRRANTLGCVLHSQLARLFVVHETFLQPSDIVMMSDADIFPLEPRVVKPLREEGFGAWVYQYGLSLRQGFTFAMTLVRLRLVLYTFPQVALRAGQWREALDYRREGANSRQERSSFTLYLPCSPEGWRTRCPGSS